MSCGHDLLVTSTATIFQQSRLRMVIHCSAPPATLIDEPTDLASRQPHRLVCQRCFSDAAVAGQRQDHLRLPISNARLLMTDFPRLISGVHLRCPISDVRFLSYDHFQHSLSDARLPTPDYRRPITDTRLPTLDFHVHFRCPISDAHLQCPISDAPFTMPHLRCPITDDRFLRQDHFKQPISDARLHTPNF